MSHYLIEQIEAHRRTSRCARARQVTSARRATDHLERHRARTATAARRSTPRRCSSSSAPSRTRTGSATASRRDERGFVLAGPDLGAARHGARAGRSSATRSCSRPRCPACSWPATCATARSSAWPAPSARARWRAVHPPVPGRPVTVDARRAAGDRPLRGRSTTQLLGPLGGGGRRAAATRRATYVMRVGRARPWAFKLLLDGQARRLLRRRRPRGARPLHAGADLAGRDPRAHRRPVDRHHARATEPSAGRADRGRGLQARCCSRRPLAFERVIRVFRPVLSPLRARRSSSARSSPRSARCRPGWRTSSTTRRPPRCAAPARSATRWT